MKHVVGLIVLLAVPRAANADEVARSNPYLQSIRDLFEPPRATDDGVAANVAASTGDVLGGELRVTRDKARAGLVSTVTIRGRVFYNDRRNNGLFSTRREMDGDPGTPCGTDGVFPGNISCALHWLGGHYMVVDFFERDTGYFGPTAWDCEQSDLLTSATVGPDGSFSATFTPSDECDTDNWTTPRIAMKVRLRFNGADYAFSVNHDDGPYALYYPGATHDAPLAVAAGNVYELSDMAFNPANTPQDTANDTSIAANYYASAVDAVLSINRDAGIPFYKDEFGELEYIYPSTATDLATTETPSRIVLAAQSSWIGGVLPAHEYGHALMMRTWDGDYGWPGVGVDWNTVAALEPRVAFKEGWANFVANAVMVETMSCELASFDDNSTTTLPGPLGHGREWVINVNKLLCDWLDQRSDNDTSLVGAGDHWLAGDLYSVWYNLRRMYLDDSLYGADFQDGLDVCDFVHYYLDVRKSVAAVGSELHDAYVEDITDLIYNNNIACFLPAP